MSSNNSADIAVSVNGASKCYNVYSSPTNRLKQFILPRLQRLTRKPQQKYFDEFWAIKSLTFDILRGSCVGIIGLNGSGKSTLLQMICGTLTPTTGEINVKGRVAALLELGSGFNPEFTGRDNIYLNGAILGLTRSEIEERYESILKFADIGEFIDLPVKTYSSGMVVRLAFAVIVHVDADVLVVDEALAVGDAVFTQKCMRFIRSFQEKGTLLFVSHDAGAIQSLCQHAIWLDQGKIKKVGNAKAVAESYLHFTLQKVYGDEELLKEKNSSHELQVPEQEKVTLAPYKQELEIKNNLSQSAGWSTGAVEIQSVQLTHINPKSTFKHFEGGEKVKLSIKAIAFNPITNPILGFLFKDKLGQDLFGENTLPFTDITPVSLEPGDTIHATFDFTLPFLPNGQYSITAAFADGFLYDHIQHHFLHEACIVTVTSSQVRWGLVGLTFEDVQLQKIGSPPIDEPSN